MDVGLFVSITLLFCYHFEIRIGMKVKTIEIAWHRRPEANHNDPVLSVDFLDDTVFATGGGDHEVKVGAIRRILSSDLEIEHEWRRTHR